MAPLPMADQTKAPGCPLWGSPELHGGSGGWGGQPPVLRLRGPLSGEENGNPSSTLAWKIPWKRSLLGYSPWVRKELDLTERLSIHLYNWTKLFITCQKRKK